MAFGFVGYGVSKCAIPEDTTLVTATGAKLPGEEDLDAPAISVVVVDVGNGREISWGSDQIEKLSKRLHDLNGAVREGALAMIHGLADLPPQANWELSEVTGSFGVTLTAEAGAILTKAGSDAVFEVAVKFTRKPRD